MTAQNKLLIANRGEIAVRIADAAFALNIPTVSLYTEDDPYPLHRRRSDAALPLHGKGVSAWLNIEGIIEIAKQNNCNLIHPGYGFLSESGQFARACEQADIRNPATTAFSSVVFFFCPRRRIMNPSGTK